MIWCMRVCVVRQTNSVCQNVIAIRSLNNVSAFLSSGRWSDACEYCCRRTDELRYQSVIAIQLLNDGYEALSSCRWTCFDERSCHLADESGCWVFLSSGRCGHWVSQFWYCLLSLMMCWGDVHAHRCRLCCPQLMQVRLPHNRFIDVKGLLFHVENTGQYSSGISCSGCA